MHLTTDQGILICVIVVAASALMQAIFMMIIAIGSLKTRKRVNELTDRIEDDVLPAVKIVREILVDASPKLKQATEEMLEVSRKVRQQVDHVNEALTDIVDKTHTQANRVDEALTLVLGGLGRAGGIVQQATGGTSRKVGAVMTGLRVGMEVLRARRKAREEAK
ncbi:MAG: hypothetical protein M1568_02075 [Acidobacteria bacterium]|jgi:hypothetical protein|nr:hypothetical protein [Acidobacteriota bacterium]